MKLRVLVSYLDDLLRVHSIPDYSPALNGLQVENSGTVEKVAVAVDATLATIEHARDEGADLLIVHHGLFWDGTQPVTGRRYERLQTLLGADLALYSSHLPLDVHPELGNNAVLARALGITEIGFLTEYKGMRFGVSGDLVISRDELHARLETAVGGPVRLVPAGPDRLERVGLITGGAGSEALQAKALELDAFITGEATHHHVVDAMEAGINLFLAGHYATEIFGVRALAQHLEEKFDLPWVFLDHPTGF